MDDIEVMALRAALLGIQIKEHQREQQLLLLAQPVQVRGRRSQTLEFDLDEEPQDRVRWMVDDQIRSGCW